MEQTMHTVREKIMDLLEESRSTLYENLDKSYASAKEALELSKEEEFDKGRAIALVRLAAVYRVKGDLEKAAEFSYKAKHRIEELGLEIHMVDVLNNLGNIYADHTDYDTALSYYMKASKILERQEDEERVNYFRYVLNNNIGEIYNELHSYDTAIEYYERSLQHIQNSSKKNYIIVPYVNIAEVYQKIRNFDKAIHYVNKALVISKESNLDFFEPDIFFCLAKIYSSKDMFVEARENYEKAIKILKEKEVIYFLVNVLLDFYKFLLKYKKEDEAIEILKETHKISINNNYKMKLSKIYSYFAEFYEKNQKYREALNYYKNYYKEEQLSQSKEAEKKVLHLKNQLKIIKIEHEKDLVQIKNIKLKERTGEVEKLYNDIKVISEMGQDITSVLDLDKVVSKTHKYFKRIVSLKDFGLVIYDETGKSFEFSYLTGNEAENAEKKSHMERTFQEFHLRNSRDETIFHGSNNSELYLSLIIEERVVGGLYLDKKPEKDYSSQDETIIKAFTNYVAIAINNAQKSMKLKDVNQKLLSLSLKDGLTEIANRRRFEEVIKREWWRAVRYKTPMSVIMFDIDRFKQYNDNYGHLAGDECIIKIAKAADQFFKRAIDLVARYGGDEFVVVLPDTELENSVELAEKLRKHVEDELRLTHEHSDISSFVTITIGVASTYPSGRLSDKKLLDVADEALYKAKEGGRNKVEYLSLSSS